MIYSIIGQPGSGKTSISKHMMDKYLPNAFHIDGDDIRKLFYNKDYSKSGRIKNITLANQIAKYLHLNGYDVIMSLVSPYRETREEFKEQIGNNIVEIYLHTSEIRGRENFFVTDYEQPINNFIDISTDDVSIDECVKKIIYNVRNK